MEKPSHHDPHRWPDPQHAPAPLVHAVATARIRGSDHYRTQDREETRKWVRAIRSRDKAYLVSLRGPFGAWFRNIRAHPQVRLRIRGGIFDGFAREIGDPSEYEEARGVYCGTLNPLDRMEYRMHRRGRPTPERIRALHERWFTVGTPVVIELSPQR